MTADAFTCDRCGGTFPKGWSDEEADAEAVAVFGQLPEEERSTVCDDCYVEFMAWARSVGLIS